MEYKEKYEGLDHLFYEKEQFIKIAEKNMVQIDIFEQNFSSYGNADLRFNVVMTK